MFRVTTLEIFPGNARSDQDHNDVIFCIYMYLCVFPKFKYFVILYLRFLTFTFTVLAPPQKVILAITVKNNTALHSCPLHGLALRFAMRVATVHNPRLPI